MARSFIREDKISNVEYLVKERGMPLKEAIIDALDLDKLRHLIREYPDLVDSRDYASFFNNFLNYREKHLRDHLSQYYCYNES